MIKLSVKKNNQTIPIFNINNSNTKDLDIDLIKTTNVNILLNRVRLDKKKMFRKKNIFCNFTRYSGRLYNNINNNLINIKLI